ncbi:hypothetical protein BCF74_13716 [Knoellia remsis]|uniref:Uncharacterized protein n=1 Tax=Knoellia remsis TaxID=407159 RepID=A0A2T0TZ42_9MICO|nr:hypothetical protein [Knoellia remsis]PRY50935.1 hypothetical protein BCF74_13716 [Knoellia remsis]
MTTAQGPAGSVSGRLIPATRPPLSGDEAFIGLDRTVKDFWRFAMSDLRMNNTRGYVAEFLVAQAVGAHALRVEWDEYDVLTPEGLRIEVKSAAYLQNWEQTNLSRITFAGLARRGVTVGRADPSPIFGADVYVFALETATDHDSFDPLCVEQWDFHVVPRTMIEALGQRSLGLGTVRRLSGGSVPFERLGSTIRALAMEEEREEPG